MNFYILYNSLKDLICKLFTIAIDLIRAQWLREYFPQLKLVFITRNMCLKLPLYEFTEIICSLFRNALQNSENKYTIFEFVKNLLSKYFYIRHFISACNADGFIIKSVIIQCAKFEENVVDKGEKTVFGINILT